MKNNKMEYILKQLIEQNGNMSQIEQMIEELSELILALQKFKRYYNHGIDRSGGIPFSVSHGFDINSKLIFNVCDEIADVKIMMEQGSFIFGDDLVNSRIDFKIKRIKSRML